MKKTNVIHIAILPMFLAGLFACTKDDEFTTRVSGKVVNRYTQEPIEEAYIYLKDGVGTSSPFDVGSNASDQRSEMYTDANGEFSLELTGEYSAYLGVSKEDYWEFEADGAGIKSYGHNGGNFENQVIELEAQAGFNPLFESTVPLNLTDSLIIFFDYIKPDVPPNELKDWLNTGWNTLCVGQQTCRFVSNASLEELTAPARGDTYKVYQIAYTRNGQWETKIDSIYIKSFETFTDTIYY